MTDDGEVIDCRSLNVTPYVLNVRSMTLSEQQLWLTISSRTEAIHRCSGISLTIRHSVNDVTTERQGKGFEMKHNDVQIEEGA
jgi:hypothetical protein